MAERAWRILTDHHGKHRIQYGSWTISARGIMKRFVVLREWTAQSQHMAELVMAKLKVDVMLDPGMIPEPDEEPLPMLQRSLDQIPQDSLDVIRRAMARLPDPLPTSEESHKRLNTQAPTQKFRAGRYFYVYLAEPVYERLAAMAVAGEVTRNRIVEALLLCADALAAVPEEESTEE